MRKFFLSILCVIFLLSCGYQTGVIQKADRGYIRFSGDWSIDEVIVKIDDREPFRPKPSDTNTLYEITSGKHAIQVIRYNKLVIDRMIFIDSQATYEVKIP